MTLLLTRSDIVELLPMADCIGAVETAFRLYGQGAVPAPSVLGVTAPDGGFHIKAGLWNGLFVSKTNANFPDNRVRFGLATIQGTIVVHDAANGALLALMDSVEITTLRTAAATAVAAKYLARQDAGDLAVIGCGVQGRAHARALAHARNLRHIVFHDSSEHVAEQLARQMADELGVRCTVADSPGAAAQACDMGVTCTPARAYLLGREHVRSGSFIAGVGADAESKHELSPDLLAGAKTVVDVLSQCAAFGDLHHALAAGAMQTSDVYAELGAIVAGQTPGRETEDEVIVFDSTGMALQDAAVAALVLERALQRGTGQRVRFTD
jgi:ornithine cyclodeaminase/alanine dehydrogenase-like protein (mu-crystallin family)